MKGTVAHLQALYGTAMFYQANVTRAQAKQAAKTKNQPSVASNTEVASPPPTANTAVPIPKLNGNSNIGYLHGFRGRGYSIR